VPDQDQDLPPWARAELAKPHGPDDFDGIPSSSLGQLEPPEARQRRQAYEQKIQGVAEGWYNRAADDSQVFNPSPGGRPSPLLSPLPQNENGTTDYLVTGGDAGARNYTVDRVDELDQQLLQQVPELPDDARKNLRAVYGQRLLQTVRAKQMKLAVDQHVQEGVGGPSDPTYWLHRVPFGRHAVNYIEASNLKDAIEHYQQGSADVDDYKVLSQDVARQRYEQNKGFVGDVRDLTTDLPATAAEWLGTGYLTGAGGLGVRGAGLLGGARNLVAGGLLRTAGDPLSLADSYMKRRAGGVVMDEKGNLNVIPGEDWDDAAKHSFEQHLITNTVFHAGNPFAKSALGQGFFRHLLEGVVAMQSDQEIQHVAGLAPQGSLLSDAFSGDPDRAKKGLARFASEVLGLGAMGLAHQGADLTKSDATRIAEARDELMRQFQQAGASPEHLAMALDMFQTADHARQTYKDFMERYQDLVDQGVKPQLARWRAEDAWVSEIGSRRQQRQMDPWNFDQLPAEGQKLLGHTINVPAPDADLQWSADLRQIDAVLRNRPDTPEARWRSNQLPAEGQKLLGRTLTTPAPDPYLRWKQNLDMLDEILRRSPPRVRAENLRYVDPREEVQDRWQKLVEGEAQKRLGGQPQPKLLPPPETGGIQQESRIDPATGNVVHTQAPVVGEDGLPIGYTPPRLPPPEEPGEAQKRLGGPPQPKLLPPPEGRPRADGRPGLEWLNPALRAEAELRGRYGEFYRGSKPTKPPEPAATPEPAPPEAAPEPVTPPGKEPTALEKMGPEETEVEKYRRLIRKWGGDPRYVEDAVARAVNRDGTPVESATSWDNYVKRTGHPIGRDKAMMNYARTLADQRGREAAAEPEEQEPIPGKLPAQEIVDRLREGKDIPGLSAKQRADLYQHVILDKTLDQIAKERGVSRQAVHASVKKSLARLQELTEPVESKVIGQEENPELPEFGELPGRARIEKSPKDHEYGLGKLQEKLAEEDAAAKAQGKEISPERLEWFRKTWEALDDESAINGGNTRVALHRALKELGESPEAADRDSAEPAPVRPADSGAVPASSGAGRTGAPDEAPPGSGRGGESAAAVPEAASDELDEKHVRDAKKMIDQLDKEVVGRHNAMMKELRDSLEKRDPQWRRKMTKDPSAMAEKIAEFDMVAGELERNYPSYVKEGEHPSDTLAKLLLEGNKRRITKDELDRQARELVRASQPTPEEKTDVERRGQQAGLAPARVSGDVTEVTRDAASEGAARLSQELTRGESEPEGDAYEGSPEELKAARRPDRQQVDRLTRLRDEARAELDRAFPHGRPGKYPRGYDDRARVVEDYNRQLAELQPPEELKATSGTPRSFDDVGKAIPNKYLSADFDRAQTLPDKLYVLGSVDTTTLDKYFNGKYPGGSPKLAHGSGNNEWFRRLETVLRGWNDSEKDSGYDLVNKLNTLKDLELGFPLLGDWLAKQGDPAAEFYRDQGPVVVRKVREQILDGANEKVREAAAAELKKRALAKQADSLGLPGAFDARLKKLVEFITQKTGSAPVYDDSEFQRLISNDEPPASGATSDSAGTPAPPDADDHGSSGDFSSEFPFRSEPRSRQLGPDLGEDTLGKIIGATKRFAGGEDGWVNLDVVGRKAREVGQWLWRMKRSIQDDAAEMSGKMYPRTTRLSRETGERMGEYVGVPGYVKLAAPHFLDQVLGKKATESDRAMSAAVLTEMRLRQIKQAHLDEARQSSNAAAAARAKIPLATTPEEIARLKDAAAGEAQREAVAMRKAGQVISIIGPDSPLQSEAQFQTAMASSKMQAVMNLWKKVLVPVMEDNFRRAQGMADTDPIISPTQIPGMPINLKGVRAGDQPTPGTIYAGGTRGNLKNPPPGTIHAGGTRGNLKNPRLNPLGFAEQAAGAGPGYDLDLGAMIEHSLAHGADRAAKADMFRTAVDEGIGVWGRPGQQVTIGDQDAREIPYVRPPLGTQDAGPGETSFYVHPEAYDELRQALAPDNPNRFPKLQGLMSIPTKVSLMSLLEAAYHSKNLLTTIFKPAWNPVDFYRNAKGYLTGDPITMQRLVELARIGAAKEGGYQVRPLFDSPYNPLTWMGHFIDALDRVQRLTLDNAFENLVKRPDWMGGAVDTETAKRDFINQVGQYNRRAQNKLVVLLRDTGVGPFATAGSNYYMQGLRTLGLAPGLEARSWSGTVSLRAEVLARVAAPFIVAAAYNFMRWGRVDGDDTTPVGALKLWEKDGKTAFLDLGNFTGVTRGARETGLLALMQGAREERTGGEIADKAVNDAITAAIHPALGPGPSFAYTAATGKDTMGRQLATPPAPGWPHSLQNLEAAVKNMNPSLASLLSWDRPNDTDSSLLERAGRAVGPFDIQERQQQTAVQNDFYDTLHDMQTRKQNAVRQGLAFPEERQYRLMNKIAVVIGKLQKSLRTAPPEQQGQIREEIVRLSRLALGR